MTHINQFGSFQVRGEGHINGNPDNPIDQTPPAVAAGPGGETGGTLSHTDALSAEEVAILEGDVDEGTDALTTQEIQNIAGTGRFKDGPDGFQLQWDPATGAFTIKTDFPNTNLPLQQTGVGDTYDNLETGTKWQRGTDGVWTDTGVPIQTGTGAGRSAIDTEQIQSEIALTEARRAQLLADISLAYRNAEMLETQGEDELAIRERTRANNLEIALEQNAIRRAELTAANTRFELGLELDSQTLNNQESQFVRDLSELARQFDLTTEEGQRQYDNSLRQREAEFVRQSAIDVAQFNASIAEGARQFDVATTQEGQQFNANLAEKGREFDVQATQQAKQFAAQMGLNYDELAATVGDANANRMLSLAVAQGDLDAQRALLQFNSAESAKDRTLALANMQAADERSRQQQIQSVARDLADFAQNPGDQNALLAFQAALGGPDAITQALGAGGTAITDASLQPGAIQLGLLEALNQPSTFLQAVQASIQQESDVGDAVQLDISPEDLINNAPIAGQDLASLADVALGEAPAPISTDLGQATGAIDPLTGEAPVFQKAGAITPNTIGAAETFPVPGGTSGAEGTSLTDAAAGTASSTGGTLDVPLAEQNAIRAANPSPSGNFTRQDPDGSVWLVNTDGTEVLLRPGGADPTLGVDDQAIADFQQRTGVFGTDPAPTTEPAPTDPAPTNAVTDEGVDDQAIADAAAAAAAPPPPTTTIVAEPTLVNAGPGPPIPPPTTTIVAEPTLVNAGPGPPIPPPTTTIVNAGPGPPIAVESFAQGGVTQENQAIVGDVQTPGVPNPELVTDIPGPGFAVEPLAAPSLAQTAEATAYQPAATTSPQPTINPQPLAPQTVSAGPVADATLEAAPAPPAAVAPSAGGIPANQPIDPVEGIRGFLTNIVDQLLATNPLFGQVPTPVNVAAPGTSLEAIESAAGLAATGRGVPRPAFIRERNRLAPRGVRQGIIGRSR